MLCKLIALVFVPIATSQSADWFNGCVNQQVTCDSSYRSISYNSPELEPVSVAGCIFTNCPRIEIRNIRAIIQSAQFINSYSIGDARGGALGIFGSKDFVIQDSKFINCSTFGSGGAIYVERSTLTLTNVLLKNNTFASPGLTGSALSSILSEIYMEKVDVESNMGDPKVSSAALNSAINLRSTTGYWYGGSCKNNFPTCLSGGGATFHIKTIDILIPSQSNYGIGGGIYLEEGCDFIMEDVNLISASTSTNCIYVWSAQIKIRSTKLTNCVNVDGKDTRAGTLELQGAGSSAQLIQSHISNSIGSKGGAIYISLGQLVINNTIIQNCTAINSGGGAVYAEYESYVELDAGTIFRNNYVKRHSGGSMVVSMDSQLVLGDCEISNSSAELFGGGMAFISDNATMGYDVRVKPGTRPIFRSNLALLDGGAIYMESAGTANLSRIVMYNNTAKRCGGALATNMNANLILGPSLVLYANNSALMGSSICIQQNGGSISLGDDAALLKNPITVEGMIWVTNLTFASLVSDLKLKWKGDFQLQGPPYAIRLVGDETQIRQELKGPIHPKSRIPDFDLVSVDYFGSPILVDPRRPVIIQIEETTHNATLVGEAIQAILEFPPRIKFSNLSIAAGPGTYSLKIKVLGFYDFAQDTSFDITVEECEPGKKYSAQVQQCLSLESVHPMARYVTSAISVIIILVALLLIRLLFKCRSEKIVKGNSFLFLSLSVVGSTISVSSVLSRIQSHPSECIVSFWLENVGFFFIYGAILLKTFRIQRLFSVDVSKNLTSLRSAYTERQLLVVFCICQVLVLVYLIITTLLGPPIIEPSALMHNKIVLDKCGTSQFITSLSIVRLGLEMTTGFLVYQIRNVPSNYNESRSIGFVAYNWILFGGALSVICDYIVTQITVSFILKQISILLPNAFLLLFLIASKLVPYMQQAFYGSYLGMTGKVVGYTDASTNFPPKTNPSNQKSKTQGSKNAKSLKVARFASEQS